ncbi:MAG: PQQ-like domain [Actinomycetota bacterium]|jgi:outer membrane protein assembly factor BamB
MSVTASIIYTHWIGVQARRPDSGDVLWESADLDPGIAFGIGVVAATERRCVVQTGDIHRSGLPPVSPAYRELSVSTGEELWRLDTGPAGGAVLLDETLVGIGREGEVVGIAPDGTVAWSRRDGVVHEVVPTDGTGAAFSPGPERLVLIDAQGTILWERQHEPEQFRYVQYIGEGLFVTGRTVDAYSIGGERVAHYRSDDPSPAGFVLGDVCIVLAPQELLAVRGEEVLWRTPVPGARSGVRSAACNEVRVDGDICVATTSRGVFAVEPADGRVLWTSEFPNGADVVVIDGDLIFTNGLGGFRVHERTSGHVVASWLIDDPQAGFHRPVAMGNGRILVALANGNTALVWLTQ